MNLQQLKYFDEICRCRSITKAADKLFISQQGLSLSIKRLETEFGCPLLERAPAGVSPTEDGLFLLERIRVILEMAKECETHFADKVTPISQLLVGTISGAASEFSASLITTFKKENPLINTLNLEFSELLLDVAIEKGEIDVGFGLAPFDDPDFAAIPLFSRPMSLIMHKSHPLAHLKRIPASALDGLEMVILNENYKSSITFLNQCKELGVNPNIKFKTGDIYNLFRITGSLPDLCGLTVISVTEHMAMDDLVAVPFDDSISNWEIDLIYRKDLPLSEPIKTFVDYVRSSMKEVDLRTGDYYE